MVPTAGAARWRRRWRGSAITVTRLFRRDEALTAPAFDRRDEFVRLHDVAETIAETVERSLLHHFVDRADTVLEHGYLEVAKERVAHCRFHADIGGDAG